MTVFKLYRENIKKKVSNIRDSNIKEEENIKGKKEKEINLYW